MEGSKRNNHLTCSQPLLVELYLASQTLEEKKLNPALSTSTSYPGRKKLKPRLDTPDNIQHTTDIPAYFNRNNLHFNKFHKVDEGVAMLPCLESVAAQRSCVDHLAKTLTKTMTMIKTTTKTLKKTMSMKKTKTKTLKQTMTMKKTMTKTATMTMSKGKTLTKDGTTNNLVVATYCVVENEG